MATWWLARSPAGGYRFGRSESYLRNHIPEEDWNALGDLRLKPGEGPVKVELEVVARRVKG